MRRSVCENDKLREERRRLLRDPEFKSLFARFLRKFSNGIRSLVSTVSLTVRFDANTVTALLSSPAPTTLSSQIVLNLGAGGGVFFLLPGFDFDRRVDFDGMGRWSLNEWNGDGA